SNGPLRYEPQARACHTTGVAAVLPYPRCHLGATCPGQLPWIGRTRVSTRHSAVTGVSSGTFSNRRIAPSRRSASVPTGGAPVVIGTHTRSLCPHAGRPGTLTVRAVFSYTRRSRSPPNGRNETTVPTGAASSHSWAPSGSLSVSPAFHGKVASSAAHSA